MSGLFDRLRAAKARDDEARRESHPNAAGGFGNLLSPYRVYILAMAVIAIPVLILVSVLT